MKNPETDVSIQIGSPSDPRFTFFDLFDLPWEARGYDDFSRFVVDIACCAENFSTGWNVKADLKVAYRSNKYKLSQEIACTFNLQTKSVQLVIEKPSSSGMYASSLEATIKVFEISGFEGACDALPNFDFSNSGNGHDEVFLVEGLDFHVPSQIVSLYSPVLSKIVNEKKNEEPNPIDDNEKEIKGIELKDVTADDFRHFLNAIYPSRHGITAANVECVLKLAEKYEATALYPKCEYFLRSKKGNKLNFVKRLSWAACYRMKDLQNDLFKSLDSLEALEEIGDDPDWASMCDTAKRGFMEVFFRIKKITSNELFPPIDIETAPVKACAPVNLSAPRPLPKPGPALEGPQAKMAGPAQKD
ncbi:unnamed protein product [Caenorhabditis auriculariae]|uniref:BTB domain-containing protein n=1 Tax=Caenorhabditis auriculariae TaxID=2777116 RepID=A0A8S1HVL9_9PELO|nr:unnamed protein product [Caenorhabditis auriculariae]